MPSKYLRQIERILEISHRMLEIKSLNVLLDYIIYQAIEEVGAERGYVILAQPNGELKVQVKRSKGVTPAEDYDQISASIVTETINSGRPLILAN
jgi:hypothetical protein